MSLRYERKFQVDHLALPLVREIIRAHPAGWRPLYPDRTIHNLYFDTPGLTTHAHNLLGASARRKVRVRWYGDSAADVAQPTLEIKRRLNQLGDKLSYPVTAWDWQSLRVLTQEVRTHVPDAPALVPQLYNRYRRAYYGTGDGRFRLTVDWSLTYLPLALVSAGSLPGALARSRYVQPGIVVELKYAAEDDETALRIAEHIPFRITKKSKYATGMLVVG